LIVKNSNGLGRTMLFIVRTKGNIYRGKLVFDFADRIAYEFFHFFAPQRTIN